MTRTPKLFISHAASDKPIVEAFFDLLESGMGIHRRAIFCTSIPGQGIKLGANFYEDIRSNLDDSDCAVALVSEAFYASAFCMCELGAIWIQCKRLIPIIIPPVTHANLRAVLGQLQVARIGDEADLDLVRDEVVQRLKADPTPTPRWSNKRDIFLIALPEAVRASKYAGSVDRATHDKIVAERDEYKAECGRLQNDLIDQAATTKKIAALKDKAAVLAIAESSINDVQRFHKLVANARSQLSKLPNVVVEAIFKEHKGERYAPKEEDAAIDAAIDEGKLRRPEDDGAIGVDDRDPEVGRAVSAVDDLATFVSLANDGKKPAFSKWYAESYDDHRMDTSLKGFWRQHLGL